LRKYFQIKKILIRDGFKWWGRNWESPQLLTGCPGDFNKCLMLESEPMSSVDAVIAVRDNFHGATVSAPGNVLTYFFILESPLASRATFVRDYDLLASYYRGSDVVTPYAKWVYYNESVKQKTQRKLFQCSAIRVRWKYCLLTVRN